MDYLMEVFSNKDTALAVLGCLAVAVWFAIELFRAPMEPDYDRHVTMEDDELREQDNHHPYTCSTCDGGGCRDCEDY